MFKKVIISTFLFFAISVVSIFLTISSFAGINQWSTNGPEVGWVYSVAISPNHAIDNTVFAGIYVGGVYKSTDRGQNWTQNGLTNTVDQSLFLLTMQ